MGTKNSNLFLAVIFLIALVTINAIAKKREITPISPVPEKGISYRMPGDHRSTVLVDGRQRKYIIHIPQNYDSKISLPVVIMLHGGGGTAKSAILDTKWTEKADEEIFLAVFPEGTAPYPSRPGSFRKNPQSWNDGSKRGVYAAENKVADIKFISVMIEDIKKRFNVDSRRIYATGFSNGASMSFRLARELPNVIAAIAPVAGGDWLDNALSSRAVPLLYITGTADPLNPINGGEIYIGQKSYGVKPPTKEIIANWVKFHNCGKESRVVYDEGGARGVAYNCHGDANAVVFYSIDGHGHHWPGGRTLLPEVLAGKNTAKLKATDIIWEFFEKHSK
jgi:polyhydroxybutyrate depolymerase